MTRRILLSILLALAFSGWRAGEGAHTFPDPTGPVSLREALAAALQRNPDLAAFDAEIHAADARVLQARLWPNPEIAGDVENIGGNGDFVGVEAAETTLQFSQLIELGGKRPARTRIAAARRELVLWNYEEKRVDVLTRTVQRFVDVLVSQQLVELLQQTVKLAEDFIPESKKRVDAGKASPAETTRGELTVSSARIELEQARRELSAARDQLAAMWGERGARFSKVEGNLDHTEPAPAGADALAQQLKSNRRLARYSSEIKQRQAEIALERAHAIPDITLSGGYRRFSQTEDNAAVIGFSIPLPLFDHNQGNIREAQARLEKTQRLQEATTVSVDTELRQAYQTLLASRGEIATLQEKILPAAQEAYNTINEGYSAGRFTFLDLLEARRTLVASRIQLLNAKGLYHHTAAEIEGLTARRPELHVNP
jgi:cobalt-zinc-cadmium efflux system outer membrane protein